MTEGQDTQGCNMIQYPTISSSSDIYSVPLIPSNLFPRSRNTCRRRQRLILHSSSLLVVENSCSILSADLPINTVSPIVIPLRSLKNNTLPVTTRFATISVGLIFLCSLSALALVYATFPQLKDDEKQHIKVPWNIEDAKQLGIVLNRYKDDHFFQVLLGVSTTYIFLQSFAIPGSLFLSILSGFLFPFFVALILVCTCSAIGASLCFLLSQLLGRRLVLQYFPERAQQWSVIVNKHKDNLLNYMVFLRVTPFLPNWFINLTSPVIGVPLVPFALGTFLGVAPPSFVAIQAGQTLHTMSANDSAFSWTSVAMLAAFAVISLIPIFMKQRLKEKFS